MTSPLDYILSLLRATSVGLLLLLAPMPIFSIEFEDQHIQPGLHEIVFSKNAIGFISGKFGLPNTIGARERLYFLLPRDKKSGIEVTKEEFQTHFGKEYESKFQKRLRIFPEKVSTSTGTTYKISGEIDCAWSQGKYQRPPGKYQSLETGNSSVRTHASPCYKIRSVEHVGNQLWIGTGATGYVIGPGEGIFVQSLKDGKLIKNISNIPGASTQIRIDPISGKVWVAALDYVLRINKRLDIEAYYRLVHDFEKKTGTPKVFLYYLGVKPEPTLNFMELAAKPERTNPLAVMARRMAKENTRGFYEVAKKIPLNDIPRRFLYDFFMCCNPKGVLYPESMNGLVPFVLKQLATKSESPTRWRSKADIDAFNKMIWEQTLCRFSDTRAKEYFLKRKIDKENQHSLANQCKRRFKK